VVSADVSAQSTGSPTVGQGDDTGPADQWGLIQRVKSAPPALLNAVAMALMLAAAFATYGSRWIDVNQRLLPDNPNDEALFEWMLGRTAQAAVHLQNPFFAPELGAPHGANLIANTSLILPGIVLTPATLLGSPGLSLAILLTVSLAGTATAWYFFLRRWVVRSWSAALAGGLLCGFAPGVVSQSIGHPHMAALFFIPLIIWVVLRLGEPGRTVRNGVYLGLLAAAQVLTGEEPLFIAALALGAFLACYAVQRPQVIRERLRGALLSLALASGAALVVVGYPLYAQFLGPHSFHGLPNVIYPGDLGAFTTYATHSLAGDRATAAQVSPNVSEQATFFGWPLLIVAAIAAAWLWRRVYVRCLAITGVIFGLLSLGNVIRYQGRSTGIPGPWRLIGKLPIFSEVIPLRLGMVLIPVIGILIAASWDRAVTGDGGVASGGSVRIPRPRGSSRVPRWAPAALVWPAVLIVAMLPAAPAPIPAAGTPPLPAFISAGQWRQFVDKGGMLVAYPVAGTGKVRQMIWQKAANYEFDIKDGYHIARGPNGRGRWGEPSRATDKIVNRVSGDGVVPVVSTAMREQARADLAYWKADCVVVADQRYGNQMQQTLTDLLGVQPVRTGGVWAWDVRKLR
jgi:hypothetical protein